MNGLKQRARSLSRFPWRIFRRLVARAVRHALDYDTALKRSVAEVLTEDGSPQAMPSPRSIATRPLPTPKETASPLRKVYPNGPKISIVVPFYKDKNFIRLTLQSVQAQTYSNYECILVDDCGDDGSASIAAEFAKADSRFRIVSHKANAGLAAARNTGIYNACGEYLLFLDADDMLFTDSIEKRVAAILDFGAPYVAGSYCGVVHKSASYAELEPSAPNPNLRVVDFISTSGNCPFSCHAPLVRSDVVRMFGGFDESFTQAEDYDLWLRILRHGYCFVPALANGVVYRIKSNVSMAVSGSARHLEASMHLFDSAYRRIDPNSVVDGAPFVYSEPLPYYRAAVVKADRVINFASMPHNSEHFAETIARFLPADTLYAVNRHKRATHNINSGIQRASGVLGTGVPAAISDYFVHDLWLGDAASEPNPERHELRPDFGRKFAQGTEFDLLFFPHKDYHVDTIESVRALLEKGGLRVGVVDFARRYRDEGVKRRAGELKAPLVPVSLVELGWVTGKTLVCFNDWDPVVRGYIEQFRSQGRAAAAVVEGVQDFLDADTGRIRNPYRNCDVVLLPGEFDQRYFEDLPIETKVAGLPNVERHWLSEFIRPQQRRAVINVNFSYNVLTDARDAWVKTAVDACRRAGVDYVLSQHPADKGDLSDYNVSDRSIYRELEDCNILISRFSTVVLEALAMGRAVIYLNSHGEKVDKFCQPHGVYEWVETDDQLTDAISRAANDVADKRDVAAEFLAHHCGVDPSRSNRVVVERLARQLIEVAHQEAFTGSSDEGCSSRPMPARLSA